MYKHKCTKQTHSEKANTDSIRMIARVSDEPYDRVRDEEASENLRQGWTRTTLKCFRTETITSWRKGRDGFGRARDAMEKRASRCYGEERASRWDAMEKRASRSRWTERERAGFEIERSRERELGLRSRYMEKRELRERELEMSGSRQRAWEASEIERRGLRRWGERLRLRLLDFRYICK